MSETLHPVIEQFDALKEKIKLGTKKDLEGLKSQLEDSLKDDFDKLQTDIKSYIEGGKKPTLTETEILNAINSVATFKNEEGKEILNAEVAKFLALQIGIDIDTFLSKDKDDEHGNDLKPDGDQEDHGLFDKDDFFESKEDKPSDTEKKDDGKEDGKEEDSVPESSDILKQKALFIEGIKEIGKSYVGTAEELAELDPHTSSAAKTKIRQAAFNILSQTEKGLKEQDIIDTILAESNGGKDAAKAAYMLQSVADSLDLLRGEELSLDIDSIGDDSPWLTNKDIIRGTLIERTEPLVEAKDRVFTGVDNLFSTYPDFLSMNNATIQSNLDSILNRVLSKKEFEEKYDKTYLGSQFGRVVDGVTGTFKEGAAGNTGGLQDKLGDIKSVIIADAGTKDLDEAEALAAALGMSVFDIFDTKGDKPKGFKIRERIKELMKEVPKPADRSEAFKDSIITMSGLEELPAGSDYKLFLSIPKPLTKAEKDAGTDADTVTTLNYAMLLKYGGADTVKKFEGLVDSIDTVYRGTSFGNAYMEYLAKTIVSNPQGAIAKPFHEWIDKDSTITPVQRAFYAFKGLFKSIADVIGLDYLAKFLGEDSKIYKMLANEHDDENPHLKKSEETEKVEKQQLQLAEWNKEDTETKALKKQYLEFASVVSLSVEGVVSPGEGPDAESGEYEDQNKALSEGINLAKFKEIKNTELDGDRGVDCTLYNFLTKINDNIDDDVLGSKSIENWTKFANIKDKDDKFIFTKEDFDETKPSADYKEALKEKIKRAKELMPKDKDEEKEGADEEVETKFATLLKDYPSLIKSETLNLEEDLKGFWSPNESGGTFVHPCFRTIMDFFQEHNDFVVDKGFTKNDIAMLVKNKDVFDTDGDFLDFHNGQNDYWIGDAAGNKVAWVGDGVNQTGEDVGKSISGDRKVFEVGIDGDIWDQPFCDFDSFYAWLNAGKPGRPTSALFNF